MKQPINNKYFMLNKQGQIIKRPLETNLETYNSPFILKEKGGDKYYQLKIVQDELVESPRAFSECYTEMTCFLRNRIQPDGVKFTNAEDYLIDLCHKYVTNKSYEEIEDFDWIEAFLTLKECDNYCIEKINYYEHSGITVSLSDGYPYNDRWDSGTYGFIGMSKEDLFKERGCGLVEKDESGNIIYEEHLRNDCTATYGCKMTALTEENWKEVARSVFEYEIETYDQWLKGECYGYYLNEVEPIYYCNHCGVIQEDIKKIFNNTQYELDGKIHYRCPDCKEDLGEPSSPCLTLHHYELIEEIDSCWGFYGDDIEANGIVDQLPIDLNDYEVVESKCNNVKGGI